jgi:hypothetical protein
VICADSFNKYCFRDQRLAYLFLGTRSSTSFGAKQQHRHADAVPYPAGCRSEKQIGYESVSVRAHGHQIAAFLLNPFDDFVGWLAKRQLGVGVDAR